MSLVITRKHNEGLFIGEDIHISVSLDQSNQVQLKIEAPDDLFILWDDYQGRVETIEEEIAHLEANLAS